MATYSKRAQKGFQKYVKNHIGSDNPTSFMGQELNKKGSKHFGKYFGGKYKPLKSSALGFGIGMAINVPRHMKSGKSLPGAMARSALSSAKLFMIPQAVYGKLAGDAIAGIPGALKDRAQKKDFAANYNFLGGDYIDTQSNYASRARAVEHIKRSRTSVQSGLGREARRYHN